jgi:hypothetical protein
MSDCNHRWQHIEGKQECDRCGLRRYGSSEANTTVREQGGQLDMFAQPGALAVGVAVQIAEQFDGDTFESKADGKRLSTLLDRVYGLMRDGRWRTLREIADATKGSEASVSARLRDLRKPRFQIGRPNGGVERERVEGGLWRYKMLLRGAAR